ncbi:TRAP transporter substrate-binding protein [Maribacter antarcticus]|uniref:TRAP transporter substrate-binding protein n=1 Tax=Maribacter antarcticus TaxID=505250 RepID=UPI000A065A19|nr:TRAP transporter substrate-binding protein [Maribacter antarcticus]
MDNYHIFPNKLKSKMFRKSNWYLWPLLVLTVGLFSCKWDNGGKNIVMKNSHNAGEKHSFQKGYFSMKEHLEKESEDKIDFQIFPAAQIATEKEAIEMVKLGVIASSPVNVGALASFVPEVDLFNFPFLFRDTEHFYNVVDGPVGKQIAKKIEAKLDCIVLGWWFGGGRNVWNKERPIHKPEDLQGLKIRVIGSSIILDGFNSFGAQATNMSFNQLYSAVSTKVIDGGECDNTDLLDMKFYEVTKYISKTEHLFPAIALIFSKKQYNKLPPDIQKEILEAGRISVAVQRQSMNQKTKEAVAELEEHGMIFNDVNKKPFQNLAKKLYIQYAEKVGGMQLIEQIINQ